MKTITAFANLKKKDTLIIECENYYITDSRKMSEHDERFLSMVNEEDELEVSLDDPRITSSQLEIFRSIKIEQQYVEQEITKEKKEREQYNHGLMKQTGLKPFSEFTGGIRIIDNGLDCYLSVFKGLEMLPLNDFFRMQDHCKRIIEEHSFGPNIQQTRNVTLYRIDGNQLLLNICNTFPNVTFGVLEMYPEAA